MIGSSTTAIPVALVETFVNPALFSGTVYTAAGWVELGQTQGNKRVSRDYYERHDEPKRLFVRELHRNARRSLQADKLKPIYAPVEAKTLPRYTGPEEALGSLKERFEKKGARLPRQKLPVSGACLAHDHGCGAPGAVATGAKGFSQICQRALPEPTPCGGHPPPRGHPALHRARSINLQPDDEPNGCGHRGTGLDLLAGVHSRTGSAGRNHCHGRQDSGPLGWQEHRHRRYLTFPALSGVHRHGGRHQRDRRGAGSCAPSSTSTAGS